MRVLLRERAAQDLAPLAFVPGALVPVRLVPGELGREGLAPAMQWEPELSRAAEPALAWALPRALASELAASDRRIR